MFPDNKSLIKAKVATRKELKLMEKQGDLGRVWWIPISWSMSMIKRSDQFTFAKIILHLLKVQCSFHILFCSNCQIKFKVYAIFQFQRKQICSIRTENSDWPTWKVSIQTWRSGHLWSCDYASSVQAGCQVGKLNIENNCFFIKIFC